jgi:hypothetical protein
MDSQQPLHRPSAQAQLSRLFDRQDLSVTRSLKEPLYNFNLTFSMPRDFLTDEKREKDIQTQVDVEYSDRGASSQAPGQHSTRNPRREGPRTSPYHRTTRERAENGSEKTPEPAASVSASGKESHGSSKRSTPSNTLSTHIHDDQATESLDDEIFCRAWHLKGEDGEPARLIQDFDGKQQVPALLLSATLADKITTAMGVGRDHRVDVKDATTKQAEIEALREDAIGRRECVSVVLEHANENFDVAGYRYEPTEADQKKLEALNKRQHRAQQDIEKSEEAEKALNMSVETALSEWHTHWTEVDKMLDEVWESSGLLSQPEQYPNSHSESSEDSYEDRGPPAEIAPECTINGPTFEQPTEESSVPPNAQEPHLHPTDIVSPEDQRRPSSAVEYLNDFGRASRLAGVQVENTLPTSRRSMRAVRHPQRA